MYWVAIASYALCIAATAASQVSYAALGDSYAAGDGAGSSRLLPNFDALCARFSQAYPVQVANTSGLQHSNFYNLACGGSMSSTVLTTQIPRIGDADYVTIQVGGNEVDFFVLLNECVHQWHPFSSCEKELARARSLVQSTKFLDKYTAMVAGAMERAKADAKVLILGYARFFNDVTEQCDHVSFSSSFATDEEEV